MRAERILSRWLEPLTDFMHAKRQRALLDVVGALMKGRRLWVTALGRALPGPAKFKHRIKRVDRLLGNPRLWSECQEVYRRLAFEVVGPSKRIVVLVDWTYVNNTEAALVASVPMSGRAQIIYAQVHGQKRVGNRAVQRGFLKCLQQVLPTGRQVVIVTDAGFGRSWFDDVTACGLHFVGRLTRNNTIRPHGAARALRVHDLFARATIKPRSLGPCEVTRDHPIEATLVVQRMKNKGRHRPKFKTGAFIRTPRSIDATSAGLTSLGCWLALLMSSVRHASRESTRVACGANRPFETGRIFGSGSGSAMCRSARPSACTCCCSWWPLPCGPRHCSDVLVKKRARPSRCKPTPSQLEERSQ